MEELCKITIPYEDRITDRNLMHTKESILKTWADSIGRPVTKDDGSELGIIQSVGLAHGYIEIVLQITKSKGGESDAK